MYKYCVIPFVTFIQPEYRRPQYPQQQQKSHQMGNFSRNGSVSKQAAQEWISEFARLKR